MTRQTSINLSEATEAQVMALTEKGFGTFTNIVRTAIDRMYQAENGHRHLSIPERIAWCAHQITVLEAVAEHVKYYRSPAIQAELGQIRHNIELHTLKELFGYDVSYGLIDGILGRIDKLNERLRQSPRHELGSEDPAFEIVRHLRNRWFGEKENDAYPNDVAEAILRRYPRPFYLP